MNSPKLVPRVALDAFPGHVTALISFVILVFDHCLTFSSEINYIWKKRKTSFSSLFLLNRYFSVLAILVYISLFLIPQECRVSAIISDREIKKGDATYPPADNTTPLIFASFVVTVLTAEAMVTLRIYAVYQNSKYVLLALSLIWIIHFVLLIWAYTGPHTLPIDGFTGLMSSVKVEGPGLVFSLTKGIIFVAPALVFDTVAGGLLTLGVYRQAGLDLDQMPLMKLVIRDGLLYFVVVFLSNIFWIIIHVYGSIIKPIPHLDFTSMEM
ncbi:hypothetical protein BDZ94DRAFT_1247909 [Collybia nuda]|uniref:DUF6533 domain-containing protein n=1 Tax=Collybia nuda TaxID=64659 RepID=A0A9P5YFY1_9AGAR|nr:hypothetical protein BDZ94DRAFT_1247909 [Collybia nuda]